MRRSIGVALLALSLAAVAGCVDLTSPQDERTKSDENEQPKDDDTSRGLVAPGVVLTG